MSPFLLLIFFLKELYIYIYINMSFPEQLTNSLGFPSSIGGWTEATGCCIQQQKF